jgi:hypothetical protein
MPGCANAFVGRGRIVKMDNRNSDFIHDLRFFNSLLKALLLLEDQDIAQ